MFGYQIISEKVHDPWVNNGIAIGQNKGRPNSCYNTDDVTCATVCKLNDLRCVCASFVRQILKSKPESFITQIPAPCCGFLPLIDVFINLS